MRKRICICDICGEEVTYRSGRFFKVKYKDFSSFWHRLDLCSACYLKIKEIIVDKDLGETMLDNAIARYEILYPGEENIDLQQAYLAGAQEAIDMLPINRVKLIRRSEYEQKPRIL